MDEQKSHPASFRQAGSANLARSSGRLTGKKFGDIEQGVPMLRMTCMVAVTPVNGHA